MKDNAVVQTGDLMMMMMMMMMMMIQRNKL
jgi:hypothetical protein